LPKKEFYNLNRKRCCNDLLQHLFVL